MKYKLIFLFLLPLCLMAQEGEKLLGNDCHKRTEVHIFNNNQAPQGKFLGSSPEEEGLSPIGTQKGIFLSEPIEFNVCNSEWSLSLAAKWKFGSNTSANPIMKLSIRFGERADALEEEWMILKPNTHDKPASHIKYDQISQLVILDKSIRYFQYQVELIGMTSIEEIAFDLLSPQLTNDYITPNEQLNNSNNNPTTSMVVNNNCSRPSYVNRTQWGGPYVSTSSFSFSSNVSHLIIHHSASNHSAPYSDDVYSIWSYHTSTLGWTDIGYNWLVAPDGSIYEGRSWSASMETIGAHFCGTNTGTTGFCFLGNFTSSSPTNNALESMTELLAWKATQWNINPTGTAYHSASSSSMEEIAGHRDGSACNTVCPGNAFYSNLGSLRSDVDDFINNGCSFTPATCEPMNIININPDTDGALVTYSDPNNYSGSTLEIEVRNLDNNNIDFQDDGLNAANNGINVPSLSPCTNYEIRITTECNAINQTSTLATQQFTTECLPCNTPTNLSISSPGGSTTAVDWNGDADDYEIQWQVNGNTESDNVSSSSYQINNSNLPDCSSVAVRVRSVCTGEYSSWTNFVSFDTECIPCPNITGINDVINSYDPTNNQANVTISWNSISSSESNGYHITYNNTSQTVSNNQISLNLTCGQTTFLSIVNICEDGSYSDNPNSHSVTVGSCPPDPCQGTNISISTPTLQNVSCFGGNDGQIFVQPSGGLAPYIFSWNDNNIIGNNPSNLYSGTYTVTVTDDNGCSASVSKTISQPNGLTIDLTPTDASCSMAGTISSTVNGGTQPYIYAWSNGITGSPDISGLSQGTYTLTITDDNGCMATSSSVVSGESGMTLTPNVGNPSCSGSNDGYIIITINGGVSPFTYLWSTGSTYQNIGNLSSGTYTITVTDATGCAVSSTSVIESNLGFDAELDITNPSCSGEADGALSTIVNGGLPPYTYNWSTGSSSISISNLNAGTYTVTVNGSDGCTTTASATISAPGYLDLMTTTTDVSENGLSDGTIVLTVQGGVPPYNYIWSNEATTKDLYNISAGSYTVTVSGSDGCTNTITSTITEPSSANCPTGMHCIYVDQSAQGNNNGSSWANAYVDLQDALVEAATIGNTNVLIAEGVYKPATSNRGISFDIPNGCDLQGGFSLGGSSFDPNIYTTILSGDIDNDQSSAGNSYHVVKIVNATTTINDLVIQEGNADNAGFFARSRGGGLFLSNAILNLNNCIIRKNEALFGGGLFATLSDNVSIASCLFTENMADNGSALYHSNETQMYISDSRIIGNVSLKRCAIEINNSLYTDISNSVIADNESQNANAIAFIATNRNQSCDINNTTIIGETKNRLLITIQVGYNDQFDLNMNNSIVAHQYLNFSNNVKYYNNGIINFNHNNCYFQGSTVVGNGTNTMFSAVDGDLMLNPDFSVNECSPVVNAGNNAFVTNTLDINGNPRISNGSVDMGAFEIVSACSLAKEFGDASSIDDKTTMISKIYPNPVKNILQIGYDLLQEDEVQFSIYNINGQLIRQFSNKTVPKGSNVESLDVSQLDSGLYFIRLNTKKYSETIKFQRL